MTREEQIKALEQEWAANPRWANVTRGYSAADVVRLRGSIQPEHTLARRGAERLWRLVNGESRKGYVNCLGALTGGQAVQQAKAGIEAMIRNAADENGVHKVRFNAIRPGFIATEIMAGIPRDSDVFRSYVENTPLGDVGEPADVGQLARFLVGPESRWITGQCINVDGGHSLRRGPDFTSFKG